MEERLIVKNFGPIRDADLDLRRYNLFIGSQATGKSTIAKLLAIFKDVEFIIEDNRDYGKIFTNYNIGNFFCEDTFFDYSNENYRILYFKEKFVIHKESAFVERIEKEKRRVEEILLKLINSASNSPSASIDRTEYRKQLYDSNWKNFFNLDIKQTYIPAERMLLSMVSENPFSLFQNLPTFFKNFGLEFEKAKRNLPVFNIDFLDIILKIEDGKQKVYYDETHSLDLSESASGLQAIVPILLVVKSVSSDTSHASFIIEEPELNLFPTTQKQLIDFLVGNVGSDKETGQLIITTHSPYILMSLNILILASIAANVSPSRIEDIEKMVPKNAWINPNDFNAFHFFDGNIKGIFDRNINLIDENELDAISDDIGGIFEGLMEIYKGSRER